MTHTVSIDVAAPVQLYDTFHAALVDHTGGRIDGLLAHLAWPTPTRPGDHLHVELEVTDVRVSKSDPRRGFITAAYDTLNQHGDVRQRTTARLLAFTKPH